MSTFTLSCRIEIDAYQLEFTSEIEINQSIKTLGSTCTLKIPRRLRVADKPITEWLKSGMKVNVFYGYNGELRNEFSGYVSRFKPGIPLEIFCEDEFYKLRQVNITKPIDLRGSPSVKEVLLTIFQRAEMADIEIVDGYSILDLRLPKYQAAGTPMEMIEDLKEKYGLIGFFDVQDGKTRFHAGPPFMNVNAKQRKAHILELGENVISHDLTRVSKADMRIGLTVIGKVGGAIESVTVGDQSGYRIKRVLPSSQNDITTRLMLEKWANDMLNAIRYDGLQGKVTIFNVPLAEVGDWAVIQDPQKLFREDYDGKYSIVAVRKSYGTGGIRRELELGPLEG